MFIKSFFVSPFIVLTVDWKTPISWMSILLFNIDIFVPIGLNEYIYNFIINDNGSNISFLFGQKKFFIISYSGKS